MYGNSAHYGDTTEVHMKICSNCYVTMITFTQLAVIYIEIDLVVKTVPI